MDENKPRRRWLSFGIRDLLWAMVVLGLVIVWWAQHREATYQRARAEEERKRADFLSAVVQASKEYIDRTNWQLIVDEDRRSAVLEPQH
jgi:hypothetical protein